MSLIIHLFHLVIHYISNKKNYVQVCYDMQSEVRVDVYEAIGRYSCVILYLHLRKIIFLMHIN